MKRKSTLLKENEKEDTQNPMDGKKKKHRNPKRAKSGPGLVIEQHQSKETIILRPPKKTRLPRKAKLEDKRRKGRPTKRWTEDIKKWLQMSATEVGREAQKREVFRRMFREATSTQTCQDEGKKDFTSR